jgi:hypothetical protein
MEAVMTARDVVEAGPPPDQGAPVIGDGIK